MLGVKESKDLVFKENDELISIFMQSVKTARKNMKEE